MSGRVFVDFFVIVTYRKQLYKYRYRYNTPGKLLLEGNWFKRCHYTLSATPKCRAMSLNAKEKT
jgi:hypothetical protein